MTVGEPLPRFGVLPQPLYAKYVQIVQVHLAYRFVVVLFVGARYGYVPKHVHGVALTQLKIAPHQGHVISRKTSFQNLYLSSNSSTTNSSRILFIPFVQLGY